MELNKIKVMSRLVPSEGSRGESVPGLFQLLVFAGIPWHVSHRSNLYFCGHIAFSSSVVKSSLPCSHKDTCDGI